MKLINSIKRELNGTATEKDDNRVSKLLIGLIIYYVVFGIIL